MSTRIPVFSGAECICAQCTSEHNCINERYWELTPSILALLVFIIISLHCGCHYCTTSWKLRSGAIYCCCQTWTAFAIVIWGTQQHTVRVRIPLRTRNISGTLRRGAVPVGAPTRSSWKMPFPILLPVTVTSWCLSCFLAPDCPPLSSPLVATIWLLCSSLYCR